MKRFTYEITDKDGFSGELTVTCENKKEAEELIKLYICKWDLNPASYTLLTESNDERG